jgi:hypothetical protein
MNKASKIKKFGYTLGLLLIMGLSAAVEAADDNENEDNYIISNQSALPNQSAATSQTSSSSQSPVKVAASTVTTSTKVITLKDSDGDGLLDGDDPHPSIAEIYIVTDEDKNGIVDSFEK